MTIDLISVRQTTEQYGYSGSHIRNLLARGVISGEKIAGVWLVDPLSVEEYQARMERLGNKKHGIWAASSAEESAEAAEPSSASKREISKRER